MAASSGRIGDEKTQVQLGVTELHSNPFVVSQFPEERVRLCWGLS